MQVQNHCSLVSCPVYASHFKATFFFLQVLGVSSLILLLLSPDILLLLESISSWILYLLVKEVTISTASVVIRVNVLIQLISITKWFFFIRGLFIFFIWWHFQRILLFFLNDYFFIRLFLFFPKLLLLIICIILSHVRENYLFILFHRPFVYCFHLRRSFHQRDGTFFRIGFTT